MNMTIDGSLAALGIKSVVIGISNKTRKNGEVGTEL